MPIRTPARMYGVAAGRMTRRKIVQLPGAEVARGPQVDGVDLAHAGDGVHQHGKEGADAR